MLMTFSVVSNAQSACERQMAQCKKMSDDVSTWRMDNQARAAASTGFLAQAKALMDGNCPAIGGYRHVQECYRAVQPGTTCYKESRTQLDNAVKAEAQANSNCNQSGNTAGQVDPSGAGGQAAGTNGGGAPGGDATAGNGGGGDGTGGVGDLGGGGAPAAGDTGGSDGAQAGTNGGGNATTANGNASGVDANGNPVNPSNPTNPSDPGNPTNPQENGFHPLKSATNFLGQHPLVTTLGAGALGLLAGKYINGGGKDDKADKPKTILPNGNVDCSQADGYKYASCVPNMINQCQTGALNSSLAAGVDKSVSSACTQFQGMYCSTTASQPGGVETVKVDGNPMPVAIPLLGMGEGKSSSFCMTVAAAQFCSQPGMDQCPSCLNLAARNTAACASDQTLCMAQSSPAQLAAALRACPGNDPMKSDPRVLAQLNFVPGADQGSGSGPGSPVVVLPQSIGGGRTIAAQSIRGVGAQHGISAQAIGSAAIQGLCAQRRFNCHR
jgi:hypothetical protein